MEDNTISVIVEGSIGNLNDAMIQGGESVDKFNATLAKMQAQIDALNAQIAKLQDGMTKTKTKTGEAVGTLALFGETTGVHIPRHLRTMLAGMQSIGPALNAAFSAIAVIALIDLFIKILETIPKITDRIFGLTDAIKKQAAAVGEDNQRMLEYNEKIQGLKFDRMKVGVSDTTKAFIDQEKAADHLNRVKEKIGSVSAAIEQQNKIINTPGLRGFFMRSLPSALSGGEVDAATEKLVKLQSELLTLKREEDEGSQHVTTTIKESSEIQIEHQLNALKAGVSATKVGTKQRMDAEQQLDEFLKQKYGANSENYKQALREQGREWMAFNLQQIEIENQSYMEGIRARETRNLTVLEIDKTALNMEESMNLIHGQKALAADQAILNKEADIKLGAIRAQITKEQEIMKSDPTRSPLALQKLLEQLYQIEIEYNAKRATLTAKYTEQQAAKFKEHFHVAADAFKSSLQGMITDYTTFSDAMNQIGKAILNDMIGMFADMLTSWIETLMEKMIFRKAIEKAEAASSIATSAAEGWAAAFASTAAIPIVGPSLAPAVAGATAASINSAQGMLAFASGGIVPYDTLAHVHQREMILPAHISDGLQNMFSGGGGGGGGDIHLHAEAMDATGVDRVLRANARSVVKLVKKQYRKGAFNRV